ncbi:2,3-bisphosphoglycerate-dependent phosphoglycerate mutase [Xanthomonas hydrangeae]|nr:2,3-bisphosphoglycerate-dependent phosphoglycerate mutase [Xanthomonas hydrangeae]CAD7736572.1 2,3-bisphosphoglycerate-dependent phosphoglycerate mutase [Xanthomonas hydrangeae]CAD7743355.1 2,3-bisphosphoglycerate-dependent phosphoglycerate mutase [Xanthomonas hydrangeae]CAD7743358.1 2,3-bisphosphoglycerate-dependent phosphoglycerate mutase [Xanthomonas hydrangeae]
MPLYFVRHGESLANEQNYFAGAQNSPLTPLGRRQAQQAARYVCQRALRFDEVHVSTLERAQATAAIILEGAQGNPQVRLSAALVERDFGIFAGKNKTLIKKSIGHRLYDACFHDADGAPPDGEHWMDMYARCKHYYDTVLAPLDRQGKQVLVVAHKYIVEVFALIASGLPPAEYIDFRLPNSRPLSWDELKQMTARSSSRMNYLGEQTEIHLLQWMLLAAISGFALSCLGVSLPHVVTTTAIVALLAANAFFLSLRIEPGALRLTQGPENIALSVISVARALCAMFLLTHFQNEWIHVIGLLLIVPPALSVPTFSLARGGDYFFAARYTLVLSILLPVLLLVLYVDHREVLGNAHALERFFVLLLLALALPCLLAQRWRRARPIAAGKLATNWGWVGSLTMVPMALLVSLRADGAALADALLHGGWPAWAALLLPFTLLMACRVGSALYLHAHQAMTGKRISAAIASDIHLLQTSPNIFLWLSLLLPGTFAHAPTLVAGTLLGFFAFALLDEAWVVRRFRAQIAPAMRKLARRSTSANGVTTTATVGQDEAVLDSR